MSIFYVFLSSADFFFQNKILLGITPEKDNFEKKSDDKISMNNFPECKVYIARQ